MKTIPIVLAVILSVLCGCEASGTRAEQLGRVAWEFQDGSETVRELSQMYEPVQPRLAVSLDHVADGMNSIAAGLDAIAAGTSDDAAGVLAQIDALLAFTSQTTWSDDPAVQTNVQASVVIARALLRRAAHTIDPTRAAPPGS